MLYVNVTTIASPVGKHCGDSRMAILNNYPLKPGLNKPTAQNAIVSIDKLLDRSSREVIGYIYTLGNGTRIYNPRNQDAVSTKGRYDSVSFLEYTTESKGKRTALNAVENSSGNATVVIRAPLQEILRNLQLSEQSCLAWPKNKPLPRQ